jgi:hypothetical protein
MESETEIGGEKERGGEMQRNRSTSSIQNGGDGMKVLKMAMNWTSAVNLYCQGK